MEALDKGLQKIADLTKQLVNYFCENEKSFKIEECISNLNTFCDRVKQCQKVKLSTMSNYKYVIYMLEWYMNCQDPYPLIEKKISVLKTGKYWN